MQHELIRWLEKGFSMEGQIIHSIPVYFGLVALVLINQSHGALCFWRLRALLSDSAKSLRRIRRVESLAAILVLVFLQDKFGRDDTSSGEIVLSVIVLTSILAMHAANPDLLVRSRAILRKWRNRRLRAERGQRTGILFRRRGAQQADND